MNRMKKITGYRQSSFVLPAFLSFCTVLTVVGVKSTPPQVKNQSSTNPAAEQLFLGQNAAHSFNERLSTALEEISSAQEWLSIQSAYLEEELPIYTPNAKL